MRWSVSEGWSFGPFKATVSKTGISVSVGVPGARVGLNTKGQANIRIGKKGFAWTKRKKVLPNLTSLFPTGSNE